jgi:Mrp family chromosome partitioning ATPase
LPAVVKAQLRQHALSGSTGSAKIARQLEAKAANAQLSAVVSRISFLNAELAGLDAPHSTTAGNVISAAHPSTAPSSPRKALIIPSGLVAGLFAGLILAICLEIRDDRVHDARDVERMYGLPTLLDLRVKGRRARTDLSPGPGSVRAFAELADYVATTPTDGSLVLLISGTSPEGTSAVAANLAAALSNVRPDVFLVCAGPGGTLVPELLGLQRRSGLTELLTGDASIDGAAQVPEHLVDLRVIGPGTNGAAPAGRYEYDARRQLIADLRAQARYVIMEAPLTSRESESPVLALGEFADAAVVAVERSTTRRQDLDGLLRHLERIRVPVMGSVVFPRLDYAAGMRSALDRQATKPKLGKLAMRA